MNHPLTDEILQQIAEDPLDGVVGSIFVKEYMRAAYDLGFKDGSQVAESMRPQEDNKAVQDTELIQRAMCYWEDN